MENKEIEEFIKSIGLPESNELRRFISNWIPDGNYDHQQNYFLSDLKSTLNEIIIKLK